MLFLEASIMATQQYANTIFDVGDLKVSHHRYYIQRMSLIVMAMTQGHIFTLLIL